MSTPSPAPYGQLVEDECFVDSDFGGWTRPVVQAVADFVNGARAPAARAGNASMGVLPYTPIWRVMFMALVAQPRSRLVTCLWQSSGEFVSMYNCQDPQLAPSPACNASSTGWVAVASQPDVVAGAFRFYDFDPADEDALPPFLFDDGRVFDGRNVAEWYGVQQRYINNTGCGKRDFYGINIARAGANPLQLVQFSAPIVLGDRERPDECGDFLGACAAAAVLPQDGGSCPLDICVASDPAECDQQKPSETEVSSGLDYSCSWLVLSSLLLAAAA